MQRLLHDPRRGANFPNPDIIAQEIVNDLEAALEQFRLIANDLGGETSTEFA